MYILVCAKKFMYHVTLLCKYRRKQGTKGICIQMDCNINRVLMDCNKVLNIFEMLQLTYYIYKWFLTGVLSVRSFHINYSWAPRYLYLRINVLMVLDKTMPFTIPSVHTAIMTRKISCTFTLLQVFPSYQVGSIACKFNTKRMAVVFRYHHQL